MATLSMLGYLSGLRTFVVFSCGRDVFVILVQTKRSSGIRSIISKWCITTPLPRTISPLRNFVSFQKLLSDQSVLRSAMSTLSAMLSASHRLFQNSFKRKYLPTLKYMTMSVLWRRFFYWVQ